MYSRRGPDERAEAIRSDAAARRLAQIASGLGAGPGRGPGPTPAEADPAPLWASAGEEPWWADHTRVAGSPGPPDGADGADGADGVFGADAATGPAPAPTTEPTLRAGTTPAQAGALPDLPVPGRHAARRRRSRPALPRPAVVAPAPRLPSLGPAHVTVIALAVALGLAVTTWWVVRDRPQEVVPAAVTAGQPAAPLHTGGALAAESGTTPGDAAASTAPGTGAAPGTVTVDVAGKVRRPGIVVLAQGARVADALAEAGGARRGVDLTSVNLARVLVDGEQVVVGVPGSSGAGAPGAGGMGAGGAGTGPAPGGTGLPGGGLVNLNLAGQVELETLPGVGPVTAQAIISWREQNGGFTSVEELLEVDGIGEKTLARLAPQVTV
ncbi:helix-hairpin-helix domain-containing protein [Nocardioides sp. zg-ZUI104]|uniref:helix-hairpin-helix domain-containing protein n=1 Tax=Nocardioides faecalis TaxID=2803858 RepID=UPI001BCFE61F|nr:helix-hairpin-helix domain-containing protein [Nocardioides faecalis]MBS4751251.1 helix-hairpin-helix domain-containing protein [Nocardioides faecalis]